MTWTDVPEALYWLRLSSTTPSAYLVLMVANREIMNVLSWDAHVHIGTAVPQPEGCRFKSFYLLVCEVSLHLPLEVQQQALDFPALCLSHVEPLSAGPADSIS